ncbi:MAG: SAM-dependent chlorinase/fluorinase [Phormidesmis sp.]
MITILSDFGYEDTYVAVMKGVVASIAAQAPTCDLTHTVAPQSILAARFHLMVAYPYFPAGTVHLAVVDPGVGSDRRAIALQCQNGFLVGPDNGLFSGVLQKETVIAAIALTNPDYWRVPKPSRTFHGRDIFAPAAAHLARGVSIFELGDRIDPTTLVTPALLPLTYFADGCKGSVQHIDTFGNLITNIPEQVVQGKAWRARVQPFTDPPILGVQTYSDVADQALSALVGSHGWLEIACNRGSAAERLSVDVGAEVEVSTFAESR